MNNCPQCGGRYLPESCSALNCYHKNKYKTDEDMVNHPKHYQLNINDRVFEVTDIIREVLGIEGYIAYLRGNILKYQIRADRKNNRNEDLLKAGFYQKILDEMLNDSS